MPERRRKAPVRRRWLSGPGVVEARDHFIPAFALGAPVLAGTAVLGALCGSIVRPAAGLLVVQGGSRDGDGPALAVHREAQLCVVGLPVAEFGTGFGVRRAGVAARAEGEADVGIPALVRWWALIRATAGHDTHLVCGSNTERSCFATICNVTLCTLPNAMGNKVRVTYLPG